MTKTSFLKILLIAVPALVIINLPIMFIAHKISPQSGWSLYIGFLDNLLAILLTVVAIVMSLMEIYPSEKIESSEKILWTLAFVTIFYFGCLLYYFIGRKKVLGIQPITETLG
jgi:hypothetical protein